MNQKSIAVLPFNNISSDTENEYFADGITEELIITLGKIEGLKVTARTSSFAYKGKKTDVRTIGNELGVSTVLEGSIRTSGKRIRITTQLIRTDNGFHIWAESFDRELTDIFQLQDEISLLIAEKIRENFGHIEIEDHLVQAKTSNIESYQQYLKGRFYQLNWKLEDFSRAIDCYKLSIKLDPQYYQPYFGIVQCYSILASWDFMDKQKALKEANYYLKKGLALYSKSPEAYFSQATNAFWVHWKPYLGLEYLNKALILSPNDTECLESSAECYTALGLFDKALERVNKALENNPLSPNHCYTRGNIHYLQGDYNEALKWMRKAQDIDPKWDLAIKVEACCYILQKDKPSLTRLIEYYPEMSNSSCLIALYEVKNENKRLSPSEFGINHTGYLPWEVYIPLYLGNQEDAIQALKQGIDKRIGQYINFRNDPLLSPLKEHPTYQLLCQKTFPLNETTKSVPLPKQTKFPRLTEEEIKVYQLALSDAMDTNRIYLNPDLSLRSLSEQIKLHPNKLSWLLNEVVGMNFNEFVNKYRLEAFLYLARQPDMSHLTILGLAYECGFNSKSVFNEFFKRTTGQTPSAWLRKNR